MNNSVKLKPFIGHNLEILFIALNPPKKSNDNGHYFSRFPNFWNQLFLSGLIEKEVDKKNADELIFGSNNFNYKNWNYGVTDLVPDLVETSSQKVRPTNDHVNNLKDDIYKYKPKNAIIIHSKVKKMLGISKGMKAGYIGDILRNKGCETNFFLVPFPHHNTIKQDIKINLYKDIKDFIDQ